MGSQITEQDRWFLYESSLADSSNQSLQLAMSPSDLNTPLSVPFMNDACIEKNKY